jgi:hypothetical protein
MKRRTFLHTSLTAVGVAAATASAAESAAGEVYELKTYTLKPGKQPVLDEYLSRAFISAVKRLGAGPVGVFTEPGKDLTFVLVVHPSADHAAALPGRLASDAAYQSAARDYLAAKPKDPVYDRIDSSLLTPIAGMPRLVKPDTAKQRVLNLRVYESHNERAAAKKAEMFNTAELAIFRKTGLTPVFFASAVAGPRLPNLTYMLVFPDDAARQAAWKRFGADPEWRKLRAIPEYADAEIVSKITNRVLEPAAYSEV